MSITQSTTPVDIPASDSTSEDLCAFAAWIEMERERHRPDGINVVLTENGVVAIHCRFLPEGTSTWRNIYRSDPGIDEGEVGDLRIQVLDFKDQRRILASALYRVDSSEPSLISFTVPDGIDDAYRDELFEEIDYCAFAATEG